MQEQKSIFALETQLKQSYRLSCSDLPELDCIDGSQAGGFVLAYLLTIHETVYQIEQTQQEVIPTYVKPGVSASVTELLSLLVLSKPAIVNFCPQCLHARTLYATPTKCRIQHFRLFAICRIPFQRQHLHRSVRPLHGSAKRASLSRKLSVPDIPRLKAQIKKREPSRLPLSPGTNP